jgi:integrase
MRHSAVSLLAAAGVPIDQLADLAGHRDATTLLSVYRHDISPAVDAGSTIAADIFTPKAEGN